MRILLTTDTIGGVWRLTCDLAQQLLSRGHAVALVSFGRSPRAEQLAWSQRMHEAYPDDFLFRSSDAPLEWMQDNSRSFSDGADLLLATAEAFEVDLVHANQFCWGALPAALPRIITAHSDVLSWGAACRPQGLENSAWLTRYCALVQEGLDGADAVVAPTGWMRSALSAGFHVSCAFEVIYNGRTLPASPTPVQRKLQAVSVGRLWDEAKGLKTLLGLDSPLPILLAGEQEFDRAAAPKTALRALGFLGETQLLQLFRESSIYLATSIYEPFGLAPLEAALCGCAIVAHDIPSLREVWADSALFYSDADELTVILRKLADSPQNLHSAQARSHQRAQRFTADRMACEYVALYERVMAQSGTYVSAAQEPAIHAA